MPLTTSIGQDWWGNHKVTTRSHLPTPNLENDQNSCNNTANLIIWSNRNIKWGSGKTKQIKKYQTKTLIITSQNEKNLHTFAMRRCLALNGRSKKSKHNLERLGETEFSDLLCPTAGMQKLLSYLSPHWRSFLLNMGERGNHVVNMMG
jgi:hypothetical protein